MQQNNNNPSSANIAISDNWFKKKSEKIIMEKKPTCKKQMIWVERNMKICWSVFVWYKKSKLGKMMTDSNHDTHRKYIGCALFFVIIQRCQVYYLALKKITLY